MLGLTLSIKPVATKTSFGRTAVERPEFDKALHSLKSAPAVVLDVIAANRTAVLPAGGKRKAEVTTDAQGIGRSLATQFSQYASHRNFAVGTFVRKVSTFDADTVKILTKAGFKGEDYAVIALDKPTKTRKAK